MSTTLTIDPVTRIEGHLSIDVKVDRVNNVQQVVDAWATGTMFRGFERLLLGRDPWDAQLITQRICGVCPTPHGMTAVMALDKASRVTPPSNARIMRNLVLGANFVQSHILHFYHLALLDFADGPDMAPWQLAWRTDKRMDATRGGALFSNYVTALDINNKIQEMAAIFGGKLPHAPAYVPGGFTAVPSSTDVANFRTRLNEVIGFITTAYLKDVEAVASAYSDYHGIGKGSGNLLAYGVFDQDSSGNTKLLKRGRVRSRSRSVQSVDASAVTEQVAYSWYSDRTNGLNPSQGETVPVKSKNNAYSWLKAPRYLGEPYEVGPLARMWVNGDYRNGVSVMDRHRSRAKEALKIAQAMDQWLSQIVPGRSSYEQHDTAVNASAYGLSEAPRGALGHWLQITNGKLSRYQIVTPTCWNASPRDKSGVRGPLEAALIGTPVKNLAEPVEVLRVVHSFDPCMACAVHVVRLDEGPKVFALKHRDDNKDSQKTLCDDQGGRKRR